MNSLFVDKTVSVIGELTSDEREFFKHQQEWLNLRTEKIIDYEKNIGCTIKDLFDINICKPDSNLVFRLQPNIRFGIIDFNIELENKECVEAEGKNTNCIIFNLAHGHNFSHFLHDHISILYNLLADKRNLIYYFIPQKDSYRRDALKYILPVEYYNRLRIVDETSSIVIQQPESISVTNTGGSKGAVYPNLPYNFLEHVHNNIIKPVKQDMLIFNIRKNIGETKRVLNYTQNDKIVSILKKYSKENNLIYHEHYGAKSLEEQIDLFARAKIVVGFHGAAMTNTAFLQRNLKTHVVEFLGLYKNKSDEDKPRTRTRPNALMLIPKKYRNLSLPCDTETWAPMFLGMRQSHNALWGNIISPYVKSWNILPYTRESTPDAVNININDFVEVLNKIK